MNTTGSPDPVSNYSRYSRFAGQTSGFDTDTLYAALLWIMFIVSVVGNSLLLGLGLSGRIRSSRGTLFLTNSLAVADLVLALGAIWSEAVSKQVQNWPFGLVWCKISLFLQVLASHATIGILAVIAIERFVKVVYSNRFTFTLNKARIMTAYVWFHSCMTNIPWLIWGTLRQLGPTFVQCSNGVSGDDAIIYAVTTRITNFFTPLALTWFAYGALLYQMRQAGKKVAAHSAAGSTIRTSQQHRTRKVTFLCLLILVAFTLTWTPFQVTVLVGSFTGFLRVRPYITPTYLLAVFNSCLNPVIYGFMWNPFKNALKQILGCGKEVEEEVTVTGTRVGPHAGRVAPATAITSADGSS